jgi:Ni,Fe-hydrogenase I large subunit
MGEGMTKISLDPVTRIEGHLKIDTRIEQERVAEAWSGGEMFRGFEALLVGRDPLDAPVITQRICGVCPVSHAVASTKAVEAALGVQPTANGAYLKNLVLGANYLQSHILHFYHLSALDFVNIEAILGYRGSDAALKAIKTWAKQELSANRILPVGPFLPRLPGDYPRQASWNLRALDHYLEALAMRREAHKMAALFGGKMPHAATLVPGGVTGRVEPEGVENFRSRLRRIRRFIEDIYLPDVLAVARLYPEYAGIGGGVGRYLSFGVFDQENTPWLPAGSVEKGRFSPLDTAKIREEVVYSRYRQKSLHPSRGVTIPDSDKPGAYSWLKAPRYDGKAYEVGPLARTLVAYAAGCKEVKEAVDAFLAEARFEPKQLNCVLGRHAARALEALLVARQMDHWLDRLVPGQPTVAPFHSAPEGTGEGLTEAPRGALGHWLTLKEGKIGNYQCVVPSTWNFSPRGEGGDGGPVEVALVGTPVNPAFQGLEIARVVRSFDPCIACAVH